MFGGKEGRGVQVLFELLSLTIAWYLICPFVQLCTILTLLLLTLAWSQVCVLFFMYCQAPQQKRPSAFCKWVIWIWNWSICSHFCSVVIPLTGVFTSGRKLKPVHSWAPAVVHRRSLWSAISVVSDLILTCSVAFTTISVCLFISSRTNFILCSGSTIATSHMLMFLELQLHLHLHFLDYISGSHVWSMPLAVVTPANKH